jgi:hypothetical protein
MLSMPSSSVLDRGATSDSVGSAAAAPPFGLLVDSTLPDSPLAEGVADRKVGCDPLDGAAGFEHRESSFARTQKCGSQPARFLFDFWIPLALAHPMFARSANMRYVVCDGRGFVFQQRGQDFVGKIARLAVGMMAFVVDNAAFVATEHGDCGKIADKTNCTEPLVPRREW